MRNFDAFVSFFRFENNILFTSYITLYGIQNLLDTYANEIFLFSMQFLKPIIECFYTLTRPFIKVLHEFIKQLFELQKIFFTFTEAIRFFVYITWSTCGF